MNALELFHMLGDLGASGEDLREYRLVTPDNRPVTGVWTDRDMKLIILPQRNTWIEKDLRKMTTRVDL